MNDDMVTTAYDDDVEQKNVKDQLRDMLRDEDERRADDARQQIEEQEEQEQDIDSDQVEEAYPDFVDAERLRDEGLNEEEIEQLREEEEANYWGVIQDNKTMMYEINEGKTLTPEDQKVLEQWQQEEENFKQYQLQKQEEQDSWFDSPIEDENNEEIEVEEVEQ